MSKFTRSILGGLLFTVWMMCFVFPIGLFMAINDHTSIGTFLGNMVINFFVLWFIFSALANAVNGMFDDMNNRGRDRLDNDKKNDDDKRDTSKKNDGDDSNKK